MRKKAFKKNKKIIIIGFLVVLLLSINFIAVKRNLEIDTYDFIIEGAFFIFAVISLSVSLEFKIKYLNIGWALFCISLLTDTIDELSFVVFPEWVDNIFQKTFLGLGIIFIAHGFYRAIKEKKRILEELRYFAFNDPLTNLPNRRYIKEELMLSIEQASKNNTKIAVLFIDLDKFKLVNDTFGHSVGDELLIQAANRLRKAIRKEDMVARLGGDEFIIILHDTKQLVQIEGVARRIIDVFKETFVLKEKHIHVTCSIGIAIFPEDGFDGETLFKKADIAMYRSKEDGGNKYRIYVDSMNENTEKKLEIAESLREALKRREFILHYQPKVEIRTGKITGLEALLRWKDPEKGLIYPNEFISIAEETGLINEIDEHVIELACLQIKEWINKEVNPINIAVNISGQLFSKQDFVDKLEGILKNTGINPSFIGIEITETEAMQDIKNAYNSVTELKKKNIKISLDDFGTGYSSLSYLKTFPIDVLKIDKLFVDGITKDKRDESLIKAAITMAKALEIKVVSEGVETKEQLNFLSEIGCDEYQGYLFSKPVPVEEIEYMLTIKAK
ncbi:putative bifunctional diguanylate cyclase/phosphodiesterase [Clostridium ganghwense]|uniref:EAL domain-containing protein n=1 Tax=Clostridium ganghwense TaxID=312089 RepID=A0ABT4CTR5_9CLOT|nr:EAL domain-containing protein [Clostridium ganghwense]MCY6371354.1 EAL domain-containing protein [Clostridium ganghwense]